MLKNLLWRSLLINSLSYGFSDKKHSGILVSYPMFLKTMHDDTKKSKEYMRSVNKKMTKIGYICIYTNLEKTRPQSQEWPLVPQVLR